MSPNQITQEYIATESNVFASWKIEHMSVSHYEY